MQRTQILLSLAAAAAALMLHGCTSAAEIQAAINTYAGNACTAGVQRIVDTTKPLLVEQVTAACLNFPDTNLPDPSKGLALATFNPKEKCTADGTAKIDSVLNTTAYIAQCSAAAEAATGAVFNADLETKAESAWEGANLATIMETWKTAFASLLTAIKEGLDDSITQSKEFCVVPDTATDNAWAGSKVGSREPCLLGKVVAAGTECPVEAAAGQVCIPLGKCMNGTGKFENEATAGCTSNTCTDEINLGASLYYPCTCGSATCTKTGTTGQSCNALTNTCTDPACDNLNTAWETGGASTVSPCTCGTSVCTDGQSCTASTNTCTDPAATSRLFTIVDDDSIPKAHSGYPVQVLLLSGAAGVALVMMVAFAVSRTSVTARSVVNGEVLDVEMLPNEALE